MTNRTLVWLGVVTVAVLAVLAVNLRGDSYLTPTAPADLPSIHEAFGLAVTPADVSGGDVVTLRIVAPDDRAHIYGQPVHLDVERADGWRVDYVVAISSGGEVIEPARLTKDTFWNAGGLFGPRKFKVRLPHLRRGTYRFRLGIGLGSGSTYRTIDLAAEFKVR